MSYEGTPNAGYKENVRIWERLRSLAAKEGVGEMEIEREVAGYSQWDGTYLHIHGKCTPRGLRILLEACNE